MSISWVPFSPQGARLGRFDEHGGEHHEHQLGTVLATHGPRSPGRLQNKLPECLGRFDEPGGEHHEHQLGTVLATRPPKPRTLAEQTARVIGAI